MNTKLQHQIALTLIPKVGDIQAKKLIAYCGGVEAVFKESFSNLQKIPQIGNSIIKSIKSADVMKRAEEEMLFIEKHEIKPLFFLDEDYPQRLKHCDDGPILLYYKGNVDLNTAQILSIVGTRQASDHGQEICSEIISQFAGSNTLIVSGLAYGIDSCSHKYALSNGLNTIGVLGHGLDRIYPAENRKYAEKMVNQGGLLTEFTKGTIPDRQNFPMRNRIVAGISDATLVVESKARGGSLITAFLAIDYNRDVFAIPGRPHDENSAGCNMLIKKNVAHLINNAKDIKELMNWESNNEENKAPQKQLFVELSELEEKVIEKMSSETISVDQLSIITDLPMSKTTSILLSLEFKGVVKSFPGKQYKLI